MSLNSYQLRRETTLSLVYCGTRISRLPQYGVEFPVDDCRLFEKQKFRIFPLQKNLCASRKSWKQTELDPYNPSSKQSRQFRARLVCAHKGFTHQKCLHLMLSHVLYIVRLQNATFGNHDARRWNARQ